MSVVYRLTDRRRVKIDDIVVSIAPLDYKVKSDMQALILAGKAMDAAILGLKNGVKAIEGLSLADGSEYTIDVKSDGVSDACINDLLNIPQSNSLNLIALSLLNGMPQKEFTDPETGKALEGVKFVEKPEPKKRKARQ